MYIRYKISHNISIKASTAAKINNNTNICICCLGNVLEASLTNCVDQTVPDVGESDLGPHDLPVCLYADVALCVFYIRGSRNFRQGGGGIQAEKSSIAWKKNSGKLFFVFSPNLQLLNSFTEGGGPIFLLDLILFVPSTIFQLYTLEGVKGGGALG